MADWVRLWVMPWVLALACSAGAQPTHEPPAQAPAAPMPLVPVNEDHDLWLQQADALLAQGRAAEALAAYQILLVQGRHTFQPVQDRRYVSLAQLARDRIARLAPEPLALYRQIHDPQAQSLYERARDRLDRPGLRRVATEFAHSSWGPPALDALGAMDFDRGHFAAAARAWQQALEGPPAPTVSRPALLARAAIAWHWAGQPDRRDRCLAELRDGHGDARAVLAGQEQDVLAFVQAVLDQPQPAWTQRPADAHVVWPSLAGAPDGQAVQPASEGLLLPRWRWPDSQEALDVLVRQAIGADALQAEPRTDLPRPADDGAPRHVLEVQDGWLRMRLDQRGREGTFVRVPPLVHPVVVDDLAIWRDPQAVRAHDIATGELVWKSLDLPMVRNQPVSEMYHHMMRATLTGRGDVGRYTLAVGGDGVYALAGFAPPIPPHVILNDPNVGPRDAGGSQLLALSLSQQGKLLWEVGLGRGDDELLAAGEFLTAPTWSAGRLYAVLRHAQAYHLACLDARNGSLVWKAVIGQAPLAVGHMTAFQDAGFTRGSPPAVAHGRVFVTTNAGLLAAFDADTGQSLWAYQYPSRLEGRPTAGRGGPGVFIGGPGAMPHEALAHMEAPSPLIVTGDTLIALPADAPDLLAVRVADGQVLWSQARQDQRQLSAIDAGRVLLSVPGLIVVDTREGRELWRYANGGDILGRPAVTTEAILAPGRDRLVAVSLAGRGYRVRVRPLSDPQGLLGNLVSAGDKLLAANAGALAVYMGFQEAHRLLSDRLDAREGPDRAAMLLDRARLALDAMELDHAQTDLEHLARLSVEQPRSGDLAEAVLAGLYRLHVLRGHQANDLPAMREHYTQARRLARTPADRGESLIRLMRVEERAGQPTLAVRAAQRLTEEFADQLLRDVAIGTDALEWVNERRLTAETGARLGRQAVARLIELHGQEVYAEFDALARKALEDGLSRHDPDLLRQALQRYPHSQWADALLLSAVELLYRRATAGDALDTEPLVEADALLADFWNDYSHSALAPIARTAHALVQFRLNPTAARFVHLPALERLDARQQVRFGDFDGTVAQLRRLIAAGPDGREGQGTPEGPQP